MLYSGESKIYHKDAGAPVPPQEASVDARIADDADCGASYGCIFCRTGKESQVVRQMSLLLPRARVISPVKARRRRFDGMLKEEYVPLLPGYVFIETEDEALRRQVKRTDHVLKLLTYADGDWRLHGYDAQFARMLFGVNGQIDFSKAFYDEGDRIRIVEGFLKEHEGSITRVNRRAKTAEISVDFHEKRITLWLGFELIEKR